MSKNNLTLPVINRSNEYHIAMNQFSELSKKALIDSEIAIQYIMDTRELLPGCINEFGVGYVPEDVNDFVKDLEKKVLKDLLQLGVLFQYRNNYGCILNERVVFPIYNLYGNVVAFSGRVLPNADPEKAKYINTRNNQIFRKSTSLFGIRQALESIVLQKYCIIVEGNIDVVSLWQAGIKNVVAPCGTALTVRQLFILRRICDRVVLWFDQDEAGQNASRKSYLMAKELEFEVGVMSKQEWKDPDEVLKNRSVEEILLDINKSFSYNELTNGVVNDKR